MNKVSCLALALSGVVGAGPLFAQVISTDTHVGWHDMIVGSGRIVSETRPISMPDRIEIVGSTNMIVLQGDAVSLRLRGDDNILPVIETVVEDGTLTIRGRGSFSPSEPVSAVLTVPSLDEVSILGSGDVMFADWKASSLHLNVKGSGDIRVIGAVTEVDAIVKGSGDIYLERASIDRLSAEVKGSGAIFDAGSREIRASVKGSGKIFHGGNEIVSSDVKGTGAILRSN